MTSVVLAHPFPDRYGVDRMLLETLDALRASGIDAVVLVPEPGPLLEDLSEQGYEFRVQPFPVLRRSLSSPRGVLSLVRGAPRAIRDLRAVLRELQPDVLYVNTLTLPFWLLAARRERVPCVCHVHESDDHMGRAKAMALVAPLLLATRVIAVSTAVQAFVVSHAPRLASRTTVVRNGMRFPTQQTGQSTKGQVSRLLVIGRLAPHKGQDLAIDALADLIREGRRVELELAGTVFRGYEWFEKDLRERVHALGLDEQVSFSGFRSDPWDAYAAADVVLVPSRFDSLPLVAIEGLAMGCPVVAADVGGLPEIVEDGATGLLCRANDAHDLARAIRTLLDDPQLARRLGSEAAVDVRRRFDVRQFRASLMSVIGEALDVRSSPGDQTSEAVSCAEL